MVSHIIAKLLKTNDKKKNPKSIQGQGGTMINKMADLSSETWWKCWKENQTSEHFYIQQKYPLKIKVKLTFFK